MLSLPINWNNSTSSFPFASSLSEGSHQDFQSKPPRFDLINSSASCFVIER